jgi:hypothetical protein
LQVANNKVKLLDSQRNMKQKIETLLECLEFTTTLLLRVKLDGCLVEKWSQSTTTNKLIVAKF